MIQIRPDQPHWDSEQTRLSRLSTWLIPVVCTLYSIALGLLPVEPMIGIVAILSMAFLVGVVLFFDVRSFAVYILPLTCFNGSSHLMLMIAVLLLVSFLAWKLNVGDISIDVPLPLWLIIIVLAGFNGLSRAINFNLGRHYLIFTVLIPIILFIIYYNLKPTTRQIRTTLTIFCSIMAIIGFASFINNILSGSSRQILTWGWGSQNRAASLLGMLLPIALVFLIDSFGKRDFIPRLLIFCGILIGILNTQTRAVLLSVFFAALYLSLKDRRVMKIMIPIILVALLLVPSLILSRMAMLFGKGTEVDWSSVGRIQIWLNSMRFPAEYYISGMGIDSFETLYARNFTSAFLKADHAHNIYLRWMFDFGIVGLLALLTLILSCFRRGYIAITRIKNGEWSLQSRTLLGINAGIVCFLIAGLADSFLRDFRVSITFWILLSFQLTLANRILKRGAAAGG